jgi:alpha-aminoadipic semialdehyde synthase
MPPTLAIRRETKSRWERRTPITPALAGRLIHDHDLEVLVQPSPRRVFPDHDFASRGARVTTDLSAARVVFGVKEIPVDEILPDTTYVYFSHVIKGQPYNMEMLAKLLSSRCTLIDYECVTDDEGRRLIFFGRFAGLAGMIDTLSILGRRLDHEGVTTPLAQIEPAHAYDSLDEAKDAVRAAGSAIAHTGLPDGLAPLVVGVAGYGNVARGVQEILHELPLLEVAPDELDRISVRDARRHVIATTFREHHLVEPTAPGVAFDLQHYYAHGDAYRSRFARYLPSLTVLVNANYWDERYPRLVTKAELAALYGAARAPRLRVIGDLGCDIGGAVECTAETTEPGNPAYVWNPVADSIAYGIVGDGPVVLAVDILPAELPREASDEFASALGPFLVAIARADYDVPFEDLDLPPAIRRAVIVHRGELTADYAYLADHVASI